MKEERFGNITLILGDCEEYMKTLPDKAYELAIVDPPYGININESIGRRKGDKHSGRKKAIWDNESPKCDYFKKIFQVSVNQIIWGANHFISKMPYDSSCWVLWDKKFSDQLSFSQFEMAWTSFNSTKKKYEISPTTAEHKFHPTQKPVALYKWLLTNYAKEGDKILDTHGGSMSIAIACHDLGFELTVIEKDPEYYESAKQRLINHQMQQKLF